MRIFYADKRIMLCMIAIVLCLAFSSHSYAGSASVVIQGIDEGSVDVVIRNISNNEPAQDGFITWSDITAGQSGWKVAGQYIEIFHDDLPEFWGMQIYTNNKDELANPKYTGTANPAGLVDTVNTLFSVPMAWRIADSVINPNTDANKPVQRPDGTGFTNYMWHFLKDKNTLNNPSTDEDESFVDGESYITLWNQSGIAWNEGGRSGNPKKAYIYLAANFTMSAVNSEYRTSELTIEAYKGVSPFPIYIYKDGNSLENHFSYALDNYNSHNPNIIIDQTCTEVTPFSGSHCFKIYWDGTQGWGGIMWLEPHDVWGNTAKQWRDDLDNVGPHPTHNGYDLRGADVLSFWARTDIANEDMEIKVYFGNTWDSCEQTPQLWRESPALSTEWQEYIIPVLDRDMSNVTGGLAVYFEASRTPNYSQGAVIYIDDIKFDRY